MRPDIVKLVKRGWTHTDDPKLRPYQCRHMELSVQADCVLWGNWTIVRPAGQSRVLDVLHDGHQGIYRIKELTRSGQDWMMTSKEECKLVYNVRLIRSHPLPNHYIHGIIQTVRGQEYT